MTTTIQTVAAIAVTVAGLFATVTAPAGPTLTAAITLLAAGACWLSHVIADRFVP